MRLQRTRHDLRGRGAVAVDQDDKRKVGRGVMAVHVCPILQPVPSALLEHLAARHEAADHRDRRGHEPAAVVAKVQDDPPGPAQARLELAVELLLGPVAELVDPQVEHVVGEAERLDRRALEVLTRDDHVEDPGPSPQVQPDLATDRPPNQR